MFKLAKLYCAAVAIVGMTFTSAAEAGYGGGTHVYSSVSYRTVHPTRSVTHYRTITHTRYVPHITRIVNVTLVRPIHHVANVTRYLHHTVVLRSSQYVYHRIYGGTHYYRTSSVVPVRWPVAYPSVHTVYRYHTINRMTFATHVRNIWVNHYAHHIYRHVTVVRVEPIVHVHTVTRVVLRTVAVARVEVVNVSRVLPARTIVTAKVINIDP